MKIIYAGLLSFFSLMLVAQPVIDANTQESIGNTWGSSSIETNFDTHPVPESGENITWDMSWIGQEYTHAGVTFENATENNLYGYFFESIDNLPVASGGNVQDVFLEGIGVLYTGLTGNRPGAVLGDNLQGVALYGSVNDVGNFYDIEDVTMPYRLLIPTSLEYGESIEQLSWEVNIQNNTLDSSISNTVYTLAGYGTLELWDENIEDVVMYERFTIRNLKRYNLSTGELLFNGEYPRKSYRFYKNGNLLPLIDYNYSALLDGTASNSYVDIVVNIPFFGPVQAKEVSPIQISLNIAPNPTKNRMNLQYDLTESTDVKIQLFNSKGEVVITEEYQNRQMGFQNETLQLPPLSAGIYFLHLSAGAQVGVQKVGVY